jgi:hypothetical protein
VLPELVLTSRVHVVDRDWITVAHAASLLGVCKRQALRRLVRRDAELDGHLLRRLGDKRMPGGVQASKYLVSVVMLRESMRPDLVERDVESLRLEVAMLRQQVRALRRAVRPFLRSNGGANGT